MNDTAARRGSGLNKRPFRVRWTVRRKIGGLATALLVLLVIVAVVPMLKYKGVRWELEKGTNIYLPLRRDILEMQSLQNEQSLAMERLLRWTSSQRRLGPLVDDYTGAFIESSETLAQRLAHVREVALVDVRTGRMGTDEEAEEAISEAKEIDRIVSGIETDLTLLEAHGREIIAAVETHQLDRATEWGEGMRSLASTAQSQFDEALLLVDGFIRDSMEDADRRDKEARNVSLAVFAIALILGTAAAGVIVRQLTRSIEEVAHVASDVAGSLDEGELPQGRIQVTTTDEVGRLSTTFNQMLESLSWNVRKREAAEEVLAAQAQQLARTNEELQRLLVVASHDLRTPLRSVVSFLQLLKRRHGSQLGEDADEYIRFAVDGGMQMQALIDDLSAYLKIIVADEPRAPTDLAAALAIATDRLRATIEETGATVTAGAMPTLSAVPSHLTLLLENLVSNAIKFRSDAPPRIEVTASQQDGDWTIAVRDNGIGIAPAYQDRIFSVFARLHGKDDYDGTGIGLAICQKVVERHGGRIWVESAPGEGSTFRFTLPA